MITKSEQISNLAAALLKAQRSIGAALKSAKNPYFKSKYADLQTVIDAVKGPLNDNGITFLQAVDSDDGNVPVIDTILLHESGQYLSSRSPVFCAKPNDPQAFGSGVTYSKRYALQALLGLPTEDDDAEAAMARNGKTATETQAELKRRIIKEAYAKYLKDRADDLGEYFSIPFNVFYDALVAEGVKALKTEQQRKSFVWTVENVQPFVDKLEIAKLVKEDTNAKSE